MVGLSKSHLQEERKTDCHPFIPTVFFWALQVVWRWYQRRRWGCRPAGSLAQLSPGEVELSSLLSNSVHCVAEAAWCQLDQFERSKFRIVPRFANLVAMFGQFVRRCVFFWMLRQLSRLFLWQHLATLKGHKCEIDSCKGSDMQESLARGAATDCRPFIPTVLFWALQVLWLGHQRRWWGRRPAGSLAELPFGEVELWEVRSNSVHCVAEAAWCQLDQFERSKLLMVPRLANLVAMFGQFVRRRVFSNVKAIVMAVSLTTFGNSETPKMWNRQLQMVRHAKVTCKRSGNRLPSFYSHIVFFSALQVL